MHELFLKKNILNPRRTKFCPPPPPEIYFSVVSDLLVPLVKLVFHGELTTIKHFFLEGLLNGVVIIRLIKILPIKLRPNLSFVFQKN